jgi:hypothetical protein
MNHEIHTTLWELVLSLAVGSLAYELVKWTHKRLRKPKTCSFEVIWPVGRMATDEELEGIAAALDHFMKAVGEGKRLDH